MLSELAPAARPAFENFLSQLDAALGEERYVVFEGRRSAEAQAAYFAQGREPLGKVNAMRNAAGLYSLRSERDNYKITWTLKSKHIEGLAMDVLPTDGAGNPTWDLAHYRQTFEMIRDRAAAAGLECGADWYAPQTDWPHYQLKKERGV
jgi:hypothetical protein